MILATDLARKPQTPVEKILCDADLDHLGRNDFFQKDGKLRKGRSARGIDVSDEAKWYTGTLNLITKHKYYTKSQILLREEKKQKNIKQLKKKLAKIRKKEHRGR
jgi:hypothetical protein